MKISYKITIIILFVTMLSCLIFSFMAYRSMREAMLSEIYDHLESVAEAKERRIKGILKSRTELIAIPAQDPTLILNLHILLTNPEVDKTLLKKILNNYIMNISSFRNIYLLNKAGQAVLAAHSSPPMYDWSTHEAFIKPRTGEKYLDGFHKSEGELNMFLSAPLEFRKSFIGVIVVERDASDILSITRDYTGLDRTGETILAKKYGDSTVLLTPVRFDPQAALNRKFHIQDSTYLVNQVATGKRGFFYNAMDYRGEQVVAAGRYIPENGWILVTKIDVKEVMLPVKQMRNKIIFINLFALMLAAGVALLFGRTIAKPVTQLQEATREIQAGNLSKRVNINSKDEIGDLATTFNQMTDKLEHKIKDLDKFAYIVSHDLKAPLASLEALLTILQEECKKQELEEDTDHVFGMAFQKVEQMNQIIHSILQTAKGEKKIRELVDCNEIVKEAKEMLNPPPDIHVKVQNNLPKLYFHRMSLLQIFQNLIGNAIKYMDKSPGLIQIGCSEEAQVYRFCITDNGPGISMEEHEKVFALFETSGQGNVKGTGIGLSIVKQVVENNGGNVWFNSVLGEGTAFYFTVPRHGH